MQQKNVQMMGSNSKLISSFRCIVILCVALIGAQLNAQNDTIGYSIYLKDFSNNIFLKNVKIKVVDDKNTTKEYKADSVLSVNLLVGRKYLFTLYKENYNVKKEYVTPFKEISRSTQNLTIYLEKRPAFVEKTPVVLFKENRVEFVDTSYYKDLRGFGEYLKDNTQISIEIIGFSDCTEKKKKKLAERRTAYIYKYLLDYGVPKERLIVSKQNATSYQIREDDLKYGFPVGMVLTEKAICELPKDEQERARKLNRRVDFKVIRK